MSWDLTWICLFWCLKAKTFKSPSADEDHAIWQKSPKLLFVSCWCHVFFLFSKHGQEVLKVLRQNCQFLHLRINELLKMRAVKLTLRWERFLEFRSLALIRYKQERHASTRQALHSHTAWIFNYLSHSFKELCLNVAGNMVSAALKAKCQMQCHLNSQYS